MESDKVGIFSQRTEFGMRWGRKPAGAWGQRKEFWMMGEGSVLQAAGTEALRRRVDEQDKGPAKQRGQLEQSAWGGSGREVVEKK